MTMSVEPHAKWSHRLKNGAPAGDPSAAPRCGALTRAGAPAASRPCRTASAGCTAAAAPARAPRPAVSASPPPAPPTDGGARKAAPSVVPSHCSCCSPVCCAVSVAPAPPLAPRRQSRLNPRPLAERLHGEGDRRRFRHHQQRGRAAARRRQRDHAAPHGRPALDVFRSVLCFWAEETRGRNMLREAAGPAAITSYLEDPLDSRLIMSMKTYLAQGSFTETRIFGRPFTLERLIGRFLRSLLAETGPVPRTHRRPAGALRRRVRRRPAWCRPPARRLCRGRVP